MGNIRIRGRHILLAFITLWIAMPFLLGCEDTDCTSNATSNLILKFYDIDDRNEKKVKFYIVSSAGSDSIFYDDNDSLSKFTLPVNPARDSTLFFFRSENGYIDTLLVKYDRRIRLISEVCGFEQVFTKLDASTTFPEIEVISNKLNKLNEEDIRIFL